MRSIRPLNLFDDPRISHMISDIYNKTINIGDLKVKYKYKTLTIEKIGLYNLPVPEDFYIEFENGFCITEVTTNFIDNCPNNSIIIYNHKPKRITIKVRNYLDEMDDLDIIDFLTYISYCISINIENGKVVDVTYLYYGYTGDNLNELVISLSDLDTNVVKQFIPNFK